MPRLASPPHSMPKLVLLPQPLLNQHHTTISIAAREINQLWSMDHIQHIPLDSSDNQSDLSAALILLHSHLLV